MIEETVDTERVLWILEAAGANTQAVSVMPHVFHQAAAAIRQLQERIVVELAKSLQLEEQNVRLMQEKMDREMGKAERE